MSKDESSRGVLPLASVFHTETHGSFEFDEKSWIVCSLLIFLQKEKEMIP